MSVHSRQPRILTFSWLACAALIALSGCRDKPVREAIERPVLFTEIVEPHQALHGRFAGSIQPQYEVPLGFRVAGRIATRQAEVGKAVRKGDLLATLEPSEQQNQLHARQAELSKAHASWQQVRDEQLRYQQLFERGVGSRARLDQLSSDLRNQEALQQRADIALQQARDHLSYTRLLAEFDGLVTDWRAEVGQVMAAGEPVVSLARPESRETVVDLPVGLVASLTDHAQIRVSLPLNPQVSVTAQIRQLSPQIDATTRTQRVRLTLNHTPDLFRIGSTVSVEISGSAPTSHRLPGSAVVQREGNAQVWVIDTRTSTLSPRVIQVLARNGSTVQVEGELQVGDKVVTAGVNTMQPGQKIRMQREVGL
ncbi:efflux RND transporter periplasmic adaptor subunit [Pseudomonas alliivorans]|nr:efflux RND transporter periplasmic adaptor subunit [Pseudomonas alliivorans]MEE4713692.1 efflux RND transporter periplasmic adaptor subunit [Pseudomonas alliivorans]MEE4728283.1 efflux RND transporter periplasmic adaptor subunit [Pseudomonas alliivorans]MEE4769656.1 efflux RND transporter periplasmic adaptor subunit [Pseudomonas alliivorans]